MEKRKDSRTRQEIISFTMSRIRSKATSIEVKLQKALWHRGIRYRKNYGKVPGSPDIAIVKHRIAIFCDGEFWHGKDWDQKKHELKNNRDYWISKIERNMERDERYTRELTESGWQVIRFWGRDILSDIDACVDTVINAIEAAEGRKGYSDTIQAQEPLMVAEEQCKTYTAKKKK